MKKMVVSASMNNNVTAAVTVFKYVLLMQFILKKRGGKR